MMPQADDVLAIALADNAGDMAHVLADDTLPALIEIPIPLIMVVRHAYGAVQSRLKDAAAQNVLLVSQLRNGLGNSFAALDCMVRRIIIDQLHDEPLERDW